MSEPESKKDTVIPENDSSFENLNTSDMNSDISNQQTEESSEDEDYTSSDSFDSDSSLDSIFSNRHEAKHGRLSKIDKEENQQNALNIAHTICGISIPQDNQENMNSDSTEYSSDSSFSDKYEAERKEHLLEHALEIMQDFLEPDWTPDLVKRILFCKIEEVQDFKLSKYQLEEEDDLIFLRKSPIYDMIPALFIAFCGNILNHKSEDGHFWLEIGNSDATVDCKITAMPKDKLEDIRSRYAKSFKTYREKEKEFKEDPQADKQVALNQSLLLWQLEGRSSHLFKHLNKVEMSEFDQIRGEKVMVIGRLYQLKHTKFINVHQCVFINDTEEKRFVEMMNMADGVGFV